MKNRIFTLIALAIFVTSFAFAQKSINPKPIKMSGKLPAYRTCGTMDNLAEQMKLDPTLAGRMIESEKMIQNWITANQNQINNSKTVVTIPVVVHIVYKAAAENISDARVQQQIDILNKDYRKLNTDIGSVPAVWTNTAADFEIQFCLASRKPDGTATTGIERKLTTVASFNQSGNPVKYASQGGLDAWDATKYLNLWVCNLGNQLLGYAQFPTQLSASPATDGVVILYNAFGLSGTSGSPYNLGRSATHEVGHWLNLFHTWGDDYGACTGSDYCNDIPSSADATYGSPNFPLLDACATVSPGVMFMNYMDYTDDAKMYMFSNNQKLRAQATLSQYRSGLATSLGCQGTTPTAPVAEFTASTTTAIIGQAITFTDQSSGTPASWAWTFGDGATSTIQNPSHSYTAAGTYSVALTATNSVGNNTMTKTNYITVTQAQSASCDTMFYPLNSSTLLYSYSCGTNSYGDLAKANYDASTAANSTVSDVYIQFIKSVGTSNCQVQVWNGVGGTPGASLASVNIPLSTIASDVANQLPTAVHFPTPVTLSGPTFFGVTLPIATTDTLVLLADTSAIAGAGVAWELWSAGSGGGWYAFNNTLSWGSEVRLAVWPVVCPAGVGIADKKLEVIALYPNPTNGTLNVILNNIEENTTITVTNMIGQTIVKQIQKPIANKAIQFDLSDQPSGIYYVNIKNSKESISRKISLIK